MVQITVKIPGKNRKCPLVELQGDLETRHQVPLSGKFIGDLHFTHTNVPVLIIGHHILQGKVISLEKPLAVLAKVSDDLECRDIAMEAKESISSQSGIPIVTNSVTMKKDKCYHIQAIIKKKILFKTRPKPIIAHVPKKL